MVDPGAHMTTWNLMTELDEGIVDALKGSWEKVKNFDSPARSTSNTQRYQDLRKRQELKRKQIKNQVPVNELSTDKLAQYKTAAALDAGAADKRGDYERGDKRFSRNRKSNQKTICQRSQEAWS
jgi:hypothetical protein